MHGPACTFTHQAHPCTCTPPFMGSSQIHAAAHTSLARCGVVGSPQQPSMACTWQPCLLPPGANGSALSCGPVHSHTHTHTFPRTHTCTSSSCCLLPAVLSHCNQPRPHAPLHVLGHCRPLTAPRAALLCLCDCCPQDERCCSRLRSWCRGTQAESTAAPRRWQQRQHSWRQQAARGQGPPSRRQRQHMAAKRRARRRNEDLQWTPPSFIMLLCFALTLFLLACLPCLFID